MSFLTQTLDVIDKTTINLNQLCCCLVNLEATLRKKNIDNEVEILTFIMNHMNKPWPDKNVDIAAAVLKDILHTLTKSQITQEITPKDIGTQDPNENKPRFEDLNVKEGVAPVDSIIIEGIEIKIPKDYGVVVNKESSVKPRDLWYDMALQDWTELSLKDLKTRQKVSDYTCIIRRKNS